MQSPVAVKAKPDPPVDALQRDELSASPEFLAAKAQWSATRSAMRTKTARLEELQTALALAAAPTPLPDRAKHVWDAVDPIVLAKVRRNPRRVELELQELSDEIREVQEEYFATHEAFEAAKTSEAARIAEQFQPQHAGAIADLAHAVEALSAAIANEREIRRSFVKVSPDPVNQLTDWSSDFEEVDLTRWDSTAAVWKRRLRQVGLIP